MDGQADSTASDTAEQAARKTAEQVAAERKAEQAAATRKAQGKSIDILREFADAANKWNISICYYINPLTDGYHSHWSKNVTAQVWMEKQKGMLKEVLTSYGPVNRLWFDGPGGSPRPTGLESAAEYKEYYDECFALIRNVSPATLTTPTRGDVCASIGSLYTNSGPAPNSTNSSECDLPSEEGRYFHPNELHGVTMQEGPGEPLLYLFNHDPFG